MVFIFISITVEIYVSIVFLFYEKRYQMSKNMDICLLTFMDSYDKIESINTNICLEYALCGYI